MKITAVILTKNEEKNIRELSKNLDFCDEKIVIDDFSTDMTVSVANKLDFTVINRKLKDDFALQKNFALKKTNNNWVLFLDADERLSDNLKGEIQKLDLAKTDYNGFYLKRKDNFLGKKINWGEVRNKKFIRLARKDSGKWERSVHEQWLIRGNVGELNNPIIHNTNTSLLQFIKKINFYSTLHARANFKEGKKSNVGKIILYPILKFKLNFFLKMGFMDKTVGFVHAALMSMHSFLSWSKLWLMQRELKS